MDNDLNKLISAGADISTLLLEFAMKNAEHNALLTKALMEGRFPTPDEHKKVRDNLKDSLAELKKVYDSM